VEPAAQSFLLSVTPSLTATILAREDLLNSQGSIARAVGEPSGLSGEVTGTSTGRRSTIFPIQLRLRGTTSASSFVIPSHFVAEKEPSHNQDREASTASKDAVPALSVANSSDVTG